MKNQISPSSLYHVIKDFDADHLKLVVEVAHKTSEAEFAAFLQTGELPAVKLSAAQMNSLKGGISRKAGEASAQDTPLARLRASWLGGSAGSDADGL